MQQVVGGEDERSELIATTVLLVHGLDSISICE